ncbi:penicillin-binding protein 2 [Candidatus Gottesmanbacteria bacterium]|nr:penicillin-binding protein 2 [Candidatus Gottesmanbacteria bacterium]
MWRSRLIFTFFLLWFFLVIGKLFYWQVLSYNKLAAAADKQHFISFTLPALRGDILASDGSILVTNQPAYLVWAEPPKVEGKKRLTDVLSNVLKMPQASVSAILDTSNALWVPLARRIDEDTVNTLKQQNLAGIGFEKMGKRYYPEASMSAQILGFVASDNIGDDKGYFGIEGSYDKELRGRDGFLRQEKDPYGFPIVIGEGERIDPENGRNVVLHIDKIVQNSIETKLKKGIEKFGAKAGSIIVMEPATGAILGMASYPSYDQSSFSEYDKELYKNPTVATSYEPGSTFKSIVMASAISEKVVTPQTETDEEGPVKISGYEIRTWDNKYRGRINMTEILQHSSNVGMVFVGEKLGKDKFLDYLEKFGFGQSTGIDLSDEQVPNLRPVNQWREIDLATATFGQGIAVTPIQMIRAVAVLANGGKLVEPHIVSKIIDSFGNETEIKPKVIRQVITPHGSKVITEMLVQSVIGGEAHYKIPKGYRIAGKTGTAQIPVAGHYDEQKTIASFVGYAPADNPKFVMLVTITEPTSSPWGSETAAPLFMDITSDLLAYYKIFPSP